MRAPRFYRAGSNRSKSGPGPKRCKILLVIFATIRVIMLARAVAEECVRIPEERKHIADEGRQHDPEIHLKVGGKERS